jgi:ubiquinone biosynthesis protein
VSKQQTTTSNGSLTRLGEIAGIATRHGFGYALRRYRLSYLIPWGIVTDEPATVSDRGRRLREMLDDLGPTFVKFGQLLSTRPDVVPADIVAALRGLQDDVSPFSFAEARAVIESELDLTIERAFLEIDEMPIASASIGQVHHGVLPDGREVAVKIQRPGAPAQIEGDISLLYQAVRLAGDRVKALDFIDTSELVDEFARSIRKELDYKAEARNAGTFYRNFSRVPSVVIPRVIAQYSTGRVLTLEYLNGTKLSELDLEEMKLDERRDLAYRMADAWMTMVFRHGFFHADPHPANVFLLEDGALGLVDFGQAGQLTADDMDKLTGLFVDAATENVDAIPRHLRALGVRYPRDREDEVLAELRVMFDRYYGVRLAEIDSLQAIREAFHLVYSLNMRLPSRFVLLDKAFATLAAVGQEVYPDFNVFEVAKPYAKGLLADRFQPRAVARRAAGEAVALTEIARELPYQVHDVLESLRDGAIEVGFVHKGLDRMIHEMDAAVNRIAVALVVLGGLIGSSLIGIFTQGGPHVFGMHVLSVVGFAISGIFGIWLLLGIVRSGRL